MKIICIVIVVALVLVFASMMWLAGFIMNGKRQTYEEAMDWQSQKYDTSFYNDIKKEDYTVVGADSYVLNVQLLRLQTETNNYMIITHGYTDNMIGSLKYAKMYLDLGYNCIIYDIRGHGKNEKTITTYGIQESRDLIYLINDTKERYNIKILGLHGESLGAASTVMALKYKPEVNFVVADCGFSDLENVLREGNMSSNLPGFVVDLASLGMSVRYHYSLDDMRPIESLSENKIPILFIHGADDNFILPKNSQNMMDVTDGYSEIHLIEGAGHAESMFVQPEKYQKYVKSFLEHVL